MVPERLRILFQRFETVFSSLLIVVLVIFCLISLIFPAIASSGAAPTHTDPANCLDVPDRTGPTDEPSTINAKIEQDTDSPEVVNISYDSPHERLTLGLELGDQIEYVDSAGFNTDGSGSDLQWMSIADEHWVTYRMNSTRSGSSDIPQESLQSVKYPYSNDSIIVQLPDHSGENVTLEAAESGFIASNTAYLGNYTTESRTVGCQSFELVIDKDRSKQFDAVARLDDLEAAAKTLSAGQKYETVTVFVTPHSLGDVGGFNFKFENTIVIEEQVQNRKASLLWVHEYIHTRQLGTLEDDLYWAIEASAEYLSYKIALDNDRITSIEYDVRLSNGYYDYGNQTLNQSVDRRVSYFRGAAVFAKIDSDLSESDVSIYDLFEWLYHTPDTGYDDLKEYLESDADLSESTVNSYDGLVFETDEIEPQYKNAVFSRVSAGMVSGSGFLFLPTFRVLSLGLLLFIVYGSCQLLIDTFSLEPDFDF